MGKSLVVKHLAQQLKNLPNNKKLRKGIVNEFCSTIPLHGISVDSDRVTRTFLTHACKGDVPVSRIFHLDMSQSVSIAYIECCVIALPLIFHPMASLCLFI